MATKTDARRDRLTLEHRAAAVCTEHPVVKAQEMCTVKVNYTVLGPELPPECSYYLFREV